MHTYSSLVQPATPENLKRIEDAERLVRSSLDIAVTHNLRVRHIHIRGRTDPTSPAPSNPPGTSPGPVPSIAPAPAARIELDAALLQQLSDSAEGSERLREIAERVGSLGFSAVSFQPFRSGSVAAVAVRSEPLPR